MTCLFCKIAQGEIQSTVVFQDDDIIAFRDINPRAPTHVLVIPKRHIATINDTNDADEHLLGSMILRAKKIAQAEGISEAGYRLLFNINSGGGQEVYHIHLHLLGGQARSSYMEQLYTKLLKELGEDTEREGLKDTPARAANAMRYLTKGYNESIDDIINGALFDSDMSELVIVKDIEMYSMCEHHLLPFLGKCHVGYIPDGKVIGLSKIARIVDFYARRLQIQERLTGEIANSIASITGARGVAVVVEAKHLCMMMRGVEKQNSVMTTSVMLGEMRNNASSRSEFLNLVR
jgi:GTP cyclohydrolase I